MGKVSRRKFLGAVGAATGVAGAAQAERGGKKAARKNTANPGPELRDDVRELVEKTPFVDTHEHLWPEAMRVAALSKPDPKIPAADFSMLFCHYVDSDLQVSGMSGADYRKLTSNDLAVADKWQLVEPYYNKCRNTGYLLCARETARILFGEDDLNKDTYQRISEKLAAGVKPGFYRHILRDVANLEYCQVNALESPVFNNDEPDPELLAQDLWTVSLSTALSTDTLARLTGKSIGTLEDLHGAIDWCFNTYGPRAIATKNQCAYGRPLDFAEVSDADAAPLFARYAADKKSLSDAENKALQDHLMHYCIDKSAEKHLPVKLHTGYFAGHNGMPLEWLRRNASDMCPTLKKHKNANFVLMHIDYPYQDEAIALAKHYSNVWIDMCWAWIINPAASVRFLKEFLMAAPASKVLTFGGDYRPVEPVVGHAAIARRGVTQAITELIEEGWLSENDAPDLVDRIMRGNAHELFPYDSSLKNWRRA
ncbi:MAG: amidohydrolase family protein [Candidatus Hydrogenedentes bacterium]|nr:amidohydrolase family protein [Candidatus Hydrogenedentota bacterium]